MVYLTTHTPLTHTPLTHKVIIAVLQCQKKIPEHADIIVVGAGHAGCEAAAAAARMGMKTLLITHRQDTIGAMSCNPSIGGLGKGQLVKEIDALDGIMGVAADAAGIHFKVLNQSKGAAVHGPRAQADRQLYKYAIQKALQRHKNLNVCVAAVGDLITEKSQCRGVRLEDGTALTADAVILTTGTFLRAQIYIGNQCQSGGRIGEQASHQLAETLKKYRFPLRRLKTGTPPRLKAQSIDRSCMQRQDPDARPLPFSALTTTIQRDQIPCHITTTNPKTHSIIKQSLHLSPLQSGNALVTSQGPRYLPKPRRKNHPLCG